MKQQFLSQKLKQAAADLSKYNQAIGQKRMEKDGLTLLKETLKTNRCSHLNEGKNTRIIIGKTEQRINDQNATLRRVKAQRQAIAAEKEKLLVTIKENQKTKNQKLRLKDEIYGRVAYELKLIETLNKII